VDAGLINPPRQPGDEGIVLNVMGYDVVVVGGGAAGLSGGLVLARARRRLALVDGGEPRNAVAAHLHGFLSRDGMSPADLAEVGRHDVARYGGDVVDGSVRAIEPSGENGFAVRLTDGTVLTTRAVLVATGLRDELPEVAGLRERWGKDVLHCPYCHGYEVRDRPLGVLGGANRPFTLHQALLLRQWSDDVVFFPDRIELTGEERERLTAYGVRIVDGAVSRLVGGDGDGDGHGDGDGDGDRLLGIELVGGHLVPTAAVFVGPRFVPRDDLLTAMGCEVGDSGWVTTDPTGRTSVPGVWAAGNVVSEGAQLINAAAAGSLAAITLNHYLLARDVEQAVTDQRAGVWPPRSPRRCRRALRAR
jgi:thioredoxin reductase